MRPRHCGNGDGRFLFGADCGKRAARMCRVDALPCSPVSPLPVLMKRPSPYGGATDPIDCLLSPSQYQLASFRRVVNPHTDTDTDTTSVCTHHHQLAYPACFGLSALDLLI